MKLPNMKDVQDNAFSEGYNDAKSEKDDVHNFRESLRSKIPLPQRKLMKKIGIDLDELVLDTACEFYLKGVEKYVGEK